MNHWPAIEAALDGVMQRRWYTNHGPAARELEAALAECLAASEAVVATNPAIATVMLAEALGLQGDVFVSALTPPACLSLLAAAGLQLQLCDVDVDTLEPILPAGSNPGAAVIATAGSSPAFIARIAGAGFSTPFAVGVAPSSIPVIVTVGAAGEQAQIGCVLTGDAELAKRLRNMRSSYGAGPPVPVRRTVNGRVSEVQAALALAAIRGGAEPFAAVKRLHGARLLPFGAEAALVCDSDAHYAAATVALGRSAVTFGAFAPAAPFPAAAAVAARSLLLPLAALTRAEAALERWSD